MSVSSVIFPAPALLSGPVLWSTAGTWLRCAGASDAQVVTTSSKAQQHFTTVWMFFWVHEKLKMIATACLFQRLALALRARKFKQMTSNLQNGKKRAAFPPVSWGLGWYHLRWLQAIYWDFVDPQVFNLKVVDPQSISENCGSTKKFGCKFFWVEEQLF